MAPRQRRYRTTLVTFIQALEGMRVVVELRHDTIVRGVLDSADDEMNLTMRNATLTPLQGDKQDLEWLYIKGHHIRCAHHLLKAISKILPDDQDM